MKIKICGIKELDTVDVLNEMKPDYAGFIFANSPRQVTIEEAKELIKGLDDQIIPVGVFVNASQETILEALRVGIKVVQLHGQESPEEVLSLSDYLDEHGYNPLIWKALPIENDQSLESLASYEGVEAIDGLLCDTYKKGNYGGTGEVFNWEILSSYVGKKPLILAGGLTIENVLVGIEKTTPHVVDINSGVETAGRKDKEKIREIITQIRRSHAK